MGAGNRPYDRGDGCSAPPQRLSLVGCNFRAQVAITLEQDEQIEGLSADLMENLSDSPFGLIEGITGLSGVLDDQLALRGKRVEGLPGLPSGLTIGGIGVAGDVRIGDVHCDTASCHGEADFGYPNYGRLAVFCLARFSSIPHTGHGGMPVTPSSESKNGDPDSFSIKQVRKQFFTFRDSLTQLSVNNFLQSKKAVVATHSS